MEIANILKDRDDDISFNTEIKLINSKLAEKLLTSMDLRKKGYFSGSADARLLMNQLIQKTEFDNCDSLIEFVGKVLQDRSDIDNFDKKIRNKEEFYEVLTSLDYIGVEYTLSMGNKSLTELSPGERGLLLLIFYLALDKNESPLIIDQPEDNLDNQSVFDRLVPAICAAKEKRQIIIVTHNPNIAVACDAEQIIYSFMDKKTSAIRYEAGSMEQGNIKKHVIDVLEGTKPAFDLRRLKYMNMESEK